MPSFMHVNGKKEKLEDINRIYVVDIKDFIRNYDNIAVREKMKLVKVIMENFFTKERKLPQDIPGKP